MFKNVKKKLLAGLSLFALSASAAMAQTTPTIDVSGPVATIGVGLVAVGTIGAAWVGFKYLQKVWRRV